MFEEALDSSYDTENNAQRIRQFIEKYNNTDDWNESVRLNNEIRNSMIRLYNRELRQNSLELSKENAVFIQINRYTRTIDMMDNYMDSFMPFLVLNRMYYVYSNGLKSISLVIAWAYSFTVRIEISELTMTDIKMSVGRTISENTVAYMDKKDRRYKLYRKILDAIKDGESGKFVPFKVPLQFGAQISRNRTGYGSEYRCGQLVWQGTYYGETTHFDIIGLIIN